MGFFKRKAEGYKAAIQVEKYRAAVIDLHERDPETYANILAQADGSEAEGAAHRDPDAYVALFMAAWEDAPPGPAEPFAPEGDIASTEAQIFEDLTGLGHFPDDPDHPVRSEAARYELVRASARNLVERCDQAREFGLWTREMEALWRRLAKEVDPTAREDTRRLSALLHAVEESRPDLYGPVPRSE